MNLSNNEEVSEDKGKTSSIYLSRKSINELNTILEFFPAVSLPQLVRQSLDQWQPINKILMHFKTNPEFHPYNTVNEIFSFLEELEGLKESPIGHTTPRINIKNPSVSPNGTTLPEYIDFLSTPENEDENAKYEEARKQFYALVNSFTEILLTHCSDFRSEFIKNCNIYEIDPTYVLDCQSEIYSQEYQQGLEILDIEFGQSYAETYSSNNEGDGDMWFYDSDDHWREEFIKGESYHFREGYIKANAIGSSYISDRSFDELVKPNSRELEELHPDENRLDIPLEEKYSLPHDPDLLLRILLVESFRTWSKKEKPDAKKLLNEIVTNESDRNKKNHPHQTYKLTIDFNGKIIWRARSVAYPVRLEKD